MNIFTTAFVGVFSVFAYSLITGVIHRLILKETEEICWPILLWPVVVPILLFVAIGFAIVWPIHKAGELAVRGVKRVVGSYIQFGIDLAEYVKGRKEEACEK